TRLRRACRANSEAARIAHIGEPRDPADLPILFRKSGAWPDARKGCLLPGAPAPAKRPVRQQCTGRDPPRQNPSATEQSPEARHAVPNQRAAAPAAATDA